MNILDRIIADKKKELEIIKKIVPAGQLEKSILFDRKPLSLSQNIKKSPSGIIAEHKRRSPSKKEINYSLNVEDVAKGYENAGACGLSVLTNTKYFGGAVEDLLIARGSVDIPILRKEFIVDEYQILETKACGADAILLIAANLEKKKIEQLSKFAQSLELEVLLEVHNREELEKSIMPSLNLIGVNNRNLKTFEVDLSISEELSSQIPNDFIKISESGISNSNNIKHLQNFGYQGFLIGENFMKTENPGEAAKKFINNILNF